MKNIYNLLTIAFLLTFSLSVYAQQTPAKAQSEAITITGVTAHIGNGSVIQNATLVFEDGKITAIGANATPKGRIINAQGKHVYPGFIAANSTLGLVEIDAVRASVDDREIGNMTPNVRSLIAYNAESKVVESMRPNGVLMGQIVPRGGRISGTSSIVQFDAWNWEDAAVKIDDGIHMDWPTSFRRGRWWMGESSAFQPNKDYESDIQSIREFLTQAKAYKKASAVRNLALEAVQGLFDGSKKLYVRAHSEKEIIDAITFAKEMGIKETVLVGGYQAYKITEFLKQNNIPVLLDRTQNTPNLDDEDYDLPYKMPKLLNDAGLLVGLTPVGRMERMSTRNLPFFAGQAVGYGLSKEDALKIITSNIAKIIGIDADYGSLEVGKSATLFISEGDALDMRTNKLTHAFIDGREISLETHHTKLYERYSEKYQSQK
jgi:imidazolonepropionase-like amidohydrolase